MNHSGASASTNHKSDTYEIGAYYFPGYHEDRLVSQWHGQGWSEWELLKASKPRFPGHRQPKKPLWGYKDEALPAVMKQKTDVAAEFGINHFIFDWYYYKAGPFLNRPLEEGYLGSKARPRVKFALMWANHDWLNIQPAPLSGSSPLLLEGAVDRKRFDHIADYIIDKYFSNENYWLIGGHHYFSIYDLPNLIKGLGGVKHTVSALDGFRKKVSKAGFRGLHLNLVHWQTKIVGSDVPLDLSSKQFEELGFDSISSYVWIHHLPAKSQSFPRSPYNVARDINVRYWKDTATAHSIPYFPNVTMGWDSSPRCVQTDAFENRGYPFMTTIEDNTPSKFAEALKLAKAFVDSQNLPSRHISINSWNEWTEGSYLEPDTVNKYAYLEAIRSVFQKKRTSEFRR